MAAPKRNRVNEEISVPQVRLIAEDGEQVGILDLADAMQRATEVSLDLVEIVPNADPPVCRLMDYGRFRFDQKKKQNEARKKQKQVQVKEVKFRPGTDIGDYQVKLKNLTRFLNEGDKAKVTMRFRGREHAHRELGLDLLRRVEKDLSDISIVEQQPQMEGRQMIMVLGPKKH
ncbi:MAG: translation initiation factor IF-3 [Lamprobacter sp.]|uniref:translation initiation factor IF-3 n=1 Tax=Lamprobacter sp. TaxID=3100796 RepID=UPI002B2633A2|nr:translation initiation factor IF-3 [Lamprobacter sp.]MEA3640030.1 translation initiation factor IF-3 [Lamprobacter sp.]